MARPKKPLTQAVMFFKEKQQECLRAFHRTLLVARTEGVSYPFLETVLGRGASRKFRKAVAFAIKKWGKETVAAALRALQIHPLRRPFTVLEYEIFLASLHPRNIR